MPPPTLNSEEPLIGYPDAHNLSVKQQPGRVPGGFVTPPRRARMRMRMRIGYGDVDRLISYPDAHNLSGCS